MTTTTITFSELLKYLWLFLVVELTGMKCNERAATSANADAATITISHADITKNSFYLYTSQPILHARDSTTIILRGSNEDRNKFFFEHPLSHERHDSADVSNLPAKMFSKYSFQYDPEETEIMNNNPGEIKLLFHGAGTHSNEKYLVTDINKQADKIIHKGHRTEFIIQDINEVFSTGSGFFMEDSFFVFDELAHYKITVKHKGEDLYSVADSGQRIWFAFYNGKAPDWRSYSLVDIFPRFGKLHFRQYSANPAQSTTLLSYNIETGNVKKYILPADVTGLMFAKNCIFLSLFFQNDDLSPLRKSLYSYIPY
jgi:hypothetical protein